MKSDAYLELNNLHKSFGGREVVSNLSIGIPKGKILALLGPSGSGKTTTLRLLTGFETPDKGNIVVDGADVTRLPPAARRFGMVFQHYALFPHLSVGENITFGLADVKDRAVRQERVREVLRLVDLAGFEDRDVSQLSGGQQQRVAVARALAPEPKVLCLDEPLSNLDPSLRERTRRELKAALRKVGITSVFVTHEQDEAFALGDVIALIRDGALQQAGTARQLYEEPVNEFVATFVGRASVVPGTVTARNTVRVHDVLWPVTTRNGETGESVSVVVRPEHLRLGGDDALAGMVTDVRYTGARTYFTVETEAGVLEVEGTVGDASVNDRVLVSAVAGHAFPVRPS